MGTNKQPCIFPVTRAPFMTQLGADHPNVVDRWRGWNCGGMEGRRFPAKPCAPSPPKAFFSVGTHAGSRAAGTENGELFLWQSAHPEAVSRIEARQWALCVGMVRPCRDRRRRPTHRPLERDRIARRMVTPRGGENPVLGASPSSLFIGTTSGKAYLCAHLEAGEHMRHAIELQGMSAAVTPRCGCLKKRRGSPAGRDGCIRAWTPTGEEILSIPAHEGAIYRMVSDGTHLWTASRDKTLKAWRLHDLSFVRKITAKAEAPVRSTRLHATRSSQSRRCCSEATTGRVGC